MVHQCSSEVSLLQPGVLVSGQPNVTSYACLIELLPLSPSARGLLSVVRVSISPPAAAQPTCGSDANTPAALSWWALTSYSHSWRCCSQASNGCGGNSSVIKSGVESRRFLCHPANWLCVLLSPEEGFVATDPASFSFTLWCSVGILKRFVWRLRFLKSDPTVFLV